VREEKVHQENQKSLGGKRFEPVGGEDHETQKSVLAGCVTTDSPRHRRLPTDSAVKSDRCARNPCTKCQVIDPECEKTSF
jgi:hypothetical protein